MAKEALESAEREGNNLKIFAMKWPSQGQDLALTGLFVPSLLDSETGYGSLDSGYLQWSEMAEEALEPVEAFEDTRWFGEPPCHC